MEAAIACVGEKGNLRDVIRAPGVDCDLKEALAELQIFTSDVVGTDGARAQLRHEQNGYCAVFGPSAGFLTVNLADVRSPLVVELHDGGAKETYKIDLLSDSPSMPSAREMLEMVAADPVAQARYFILAMRLFCEHVLGSAPVDNFLRLNGRLEGSAFPDGFAASGLGGAFGCIAAYHGPIEEQARLSIHPHMLLWFVHSTSETWLRNVLRGNSEEGRKRLAEWQMRVLSAVQSMQLDSAAVLPLLCTEELDSAPQPRSTPFTKQQQQMCKFDGELEGDLHDPDLRRPLVAEEAPFLDHYIRKHIERFPADVEPEANLWFLLWKPNGSLTFVCVRYDYDNI